MFNLFSKKESDLDGKTFKQRFEAANNAVLIDVRTPGEFASGSISGARNIDVMGSDFQNELSKLDKDKTYFLFCRSGSRSGSAAAIFKKMGLNSYNLLGGIGAWGR